MNRPLLLAVGHGSRDPRSSTTVESLVAAVLRDTPGIEARAAFLDLSAPRVPDALVEAYQDGYHDVVAVPLLLTEAFHARVDLPDALAGAISALPGLHCCQAAVLGPDPLLVDALERRLRECHEWPGDPGTAVVLAAAGTSDPRGRATIEGVAAGWRSCGWWAVEVAYASAGGPTVAETVRALRWRGAPRVVVAPYVLAPGLLPDRIAAGAAGADALSQPMGAAPEIVQLVVRRYTEAAATLTPTPHPSPITRDHALVARAGTPSG